MSLTARFSVLSGCRQIAFHKNRIGWIEGQCGSSAEVYFSSCRHADLADRIEEAHQAEPLEASKGIKAAAALQRCSFHRVEEINGNRIDLQLPKCQGQLHGVGIFFSPSP